MTVSYAKHKIKVLLLEGVHQHACRLFENEQYQVTYLSQSLSEEDLCEQIKDVHIVGIRSKTHITRNVLEAANHLWAVGAFCIGTNQIDLTACCEQGVAVFNAPYSNTRSVVELAIAEIIVLMRSVLTKSHEVHTGIWQKTAAGNNEVRGKKLGIVGYGNIGAQLSVLAENLGMQVYYYDKVEKLALGNAHKCHSLTDLLKTVDVVSLHVDGNKANAHLIAEHELACMKKGSYLVNLSRGHVVDLQALSIVLKNGHLAGAGIDVFATEPTANNEFFHHVLQGIPNVILTPHIGGSTEEAQHNIADFVPRHAINYMNTGDSHMSVNFPQIQLSGFDNSHRLIHIHHNEPGVLASINQLFADHAINIVGQYLKTNEEMGYVITDIDKTYPAALFNQLQQIPHTIKFSALY
jgi:D-3-phosphoglycerate dehydrogenase / 2-oxoglutarate reductase